MNTVTSKDGTLIAYDKLGTGPAVILFDGAFCSRDFGPMPKLAPLLAPHFTIYVYDRRARGDSGDTKPYAVEREIEDLEVMINEAGGSAHIFSISSGAMLALRAAAHKGVGMKKLAIYEPPYMVGNPKHLPPADHNEQLTKLIAENRRSDAVKYYMTKLIGMPAILPGVMQLLPMWSSMKKNAPSLPYDSAVAGDFKLPSQLLASITIPTLVVGGEKSQKVLRDSVQAVADTIPNAKLRVLKGQTHNMKVEVLSPVLTEFFTS